MARASLRPSLRPTRAPAPTRSLPPERASLRAIRPSGSLRAPALNEELWFGATTDDAAEHRAAESLAAKVGRILGAKPFPEAARRLDELTRGVTCPVDDVVRVLETDPALSARLLRLVNSAGYALRLRCSSVRHASVLVGTRRLNQLATTAAVLDLFETSTQAAGHLVEHSSLVGSLCRYLAVHLGLPRDELATCGFLHDIGKLMLLDTESDRYAEMLREHAGAPDAIHAHERDAFGFDHAVLGAHVLAAWNIPDPVPKVVAWHHQPARALQVGGMVSAMVQALRLADAVAYALDHEPKHTAIPRLAASEMASFLEVSEPQLAQMWPDFEGLQHVARTRGRGVPEPDVLPRRPSFEPKSIRPSRIVTRVPKHFACGVCQLASFGTTCTACGTFVCPEHWAASEQWCTECLGRYRRVVAGSLWGTALVCAGMVGGSAGIAALLSGATALPALGVATSASAFAATLALVGGRALRRWRFLRERAEVRSSASLAPTQLLERIEVPPLPGPETLAHLPEHHAHVDEPIPIQALGLLPLDDPRRSAVTDPAPAPEPGFAPAPPPDLGHAETVVGLATALVPHGPPPPPVEDPCADPQGSQHAHPSGPIAAAGPERPASSAPPSSGTRDSARAAPPDPPPSPASDPLASSDPAPHELQTMPPQAARAELDSVQPLALPTLEQLSEPPPRQLAREWSTRGGVRPKTCCSTAQRIWHPCCPPA